MKQTVRDVWVKGLPHNTTIIVRWTNTDALPDGSRYENHGVHIVKMRWGKLDVMDADELSRRAQVPPERLGTYLRALGPGEAYIG